MTIVLHLTIVHIQYVLQSGCCRTAVDFTTACTVHVPMYCTFHFPKVHFAQHNALSWVSHQSHVVNENSMAAKWEWQGSPSFERSKMPHPKTVQCKTVAMTNMANKPPACCPEGGKERKILNRVDCWCLEKRSEAQKRLNRMLFNQTKQDRT